MKLRCVIAITSIGVALLSFALLCSSRKTFPTLPAPNGYDVLVSVMEIIPQQPNDLQTQDLISLKLLVSSNAGALAKVRGAFAKDWGVPVSIEPDYMPNVVSNVMLTRTLARAFCAEGRLAELEGHTNDALNAYSDCIQLGYKASRGGLIIHNLTGIACKRLGSKESWKVIPTSSTPALQNLLSKLMKLESSIESVEAVIERDHDWSRGNMGWFWSSAQSVLMRSTLQHTRATTRTSHRRAQAELRLLRTDVALELFKRKNGNYPTNISELVPEFMEAAPVDPFVGKPLVYRALTNSYLLYSVGANEKDDGGTPSPQGWGEAGPNGFPNVPERGDVLSTAPR